jgi:hypothetical protein
MLFRLFCLQKGTGKCFNQSWSINSLPLIISSRIYCLEEVADTLLPRSKLLKRPAGAAGSERLANKPGRSTSHRIAHERGSDETPHTRIWTESERGLILIVARRGWSERMRPPDRSNRRHAPRRSGWFARRVWHVSVLSSRNRMICPLHGWRRVVGGSGHRFFFLWPGIARSGADDGTLPSSLAANASCGLSTNVSALQSSLVASLKYTE